MKFFKIFLFICLGAWILACSDETINSERTGVTPSDIVYNDSLRSFQFLTDLYWHLPTGYRFDQVVCSTDEAVWAVPGSAAQRWGEGAWSPSALRDNLFDRCYQGIRRSFVFQNEIYPNIPDHIISPNGKTRMMAQVLFLRAYFNFELLKRFGGYPLVDHLLSDVEDLNIPRSTYDKCVEYIVELCDAAAEELPESYPGEQFGRATKGAALALKARVLLYAASPLFNDPAKTSDDLEHGAYSPAKWEQAAKAAVDVINLNRYSLYNSYPNFFLNLSPNSEIIISRVAGDSRDLEEDNGPSGYTRGGGGTCPTWDLVCAYEMLNGEPFDPENAAHMANPFAGRDPRFAASILYNGADWMQNRRIETFEGGLDKTGERATPTSFYLRKFLSRTAQWTGTTGVANHSFPLIRYGEVLLNYAEAMNEAYGPDNDNGYGLTARDAIEMIRERAGLTGNIDLSNTVSADDKDKMREAIRHERRIELVFEEHRHLDLRRWKTAEIVLNQAVSGLKIERATGGALTYTPIPNVQNRIFNAKMYLYPFPQTEMARNSRLIQNTDW